MGSYGLGYGLLLGALLAGFDLGAGKLKQLSQGVTKVLQPVGGVAMIAMGFFTIWRAHA